MVKGCSSMKYKNQLKPLMEDEPKGRGLKIAFIGAGSAVWSSRIIIDLILAKSLHGARVYLMDINRERRNLITSFAKRYASELHADLEFVPTTDRIEAIKDADFVVNSAMYGGHMYYERMREICERHGYYRGINSVEWNMVSDYHTIWGYYQFKLALSIAKDVEEYAPDAWLINVANPVFELTTLIQRHVKIKMIGLCHGYHGIYNVMKELGLPREETEFEVLGFNHVIWLTKFKYKGEDAYPLLDKWIEEKAEKYWGRWRETQVNPFDIDLSPAAIDMYKRYGLLPVGDTVRGGTWMYHWDLKTKQKWYGPTGGPDSEIGWMMYIAYLNMQLQRLYEALRDQKHPLAVHIPPEWSGESIVPIIDSIANNRRGEYIVNTLNLGSIPGIPDNVAVEMPVQIDGKGLHRYIFEPLPKKIRDLVLLPRMTRMEMALTAFLEGGREILEDWLHMDPRTKSTRQVQETIDDLLNMPGNEEMKKHFG